MMDYYVIGRANNDNYPLLEWDDDEELDISLAHSAQDGVPAVIPRPLRLCLGSPFRHKSQMVDYHSLPKPVVGKKIKDVLEPLNIYGTQLLPAQVAVGATVYDYWLLHVFNRITCVDRTLSVLTVDEDDDDDTNNILDIERLALDEKVLKKIPEDKRLIFVLAEDTPTYLFHAKIKDAVMAVQPEGVRFFKASEWGSDAPFRP